MVVGYQHFWKPPYNVLYHVFFSVFFCTQKNFDPPKNLAISRLCPSLSMDVMSGGVALVGINQGRCQRGKPSMLGFPVFRAHGSHPKPSGSQPKPSRFFV